MIFVSGILTINDLKAQKQETKTVCFKSSMHCENCEKTLTDYLSFEKGVKNLRVDVETNTILVEYKEGKSSDETIAKAIKKKGYDANKISIEEYNKIKTEVSDSEKK